MTATAKQFNYRDKAAELEQMIARLEGGELDIDQALVVYEKAQKLINELEKYLEAAENTVLKAIKL